MATMKVKIITDVRQKRKRGVMTYSTVGVTDASYLCYISMDAVVPNVEKGANVIMKLIRIYNREEDVFVHCGPDTKVRFIVTPVMEFLL